ncbi:cytochrome c biogenesis protein [Alicyclobacillus tolerans]|uniref:cytochrome C assembly family protein n=1 Tax=Alicyclobacillus tolerans TaxID=90970 RepID=UPI001F4723DE|nr:cytochrome c biogenesis protein CcsA [Alicyclobacillus tolerans]MCF8563535.1 cytochrome c biogenesis protein [Alicyclobacillus tolerans]
MAFRVLYDIFGAVYAVSLVLFFIDAVQPRRTVNRAALILLFVAFALETGFLLLRLAELGYAPVYSPFDSMLLLSWLILSVALVVNTFFRVDLFLFFANLLGFSLVVFDAFSRTGLVEYSARQGDLLVLHIALAMFSYACFSFAFIFSFMYLIQRRLLREKRWHTWFFRLPSLESLDLYAYRFILIGFPVLLVAMVLGSIWERITLGHLSLSDPKPLATIVLWMMYGGYLFVRKRTGWGSAKYNWYNLFCFAALVLNYVIVGSFSAFHHV